MSGGGWKHEEDPIHYTVASPYNLDLRIQSKRRPDEEPYPLLVLDGEASTLSNRPWPHILAFGLGIYPAGVNSLRAWLRASSYLALMVYSDKSFYGESPGRDYWCCRLAMHLLGYKKSISRDVFVHWLLPEISMWELASR